MPKCPTITINKISNLLSVFIRRISYTKGKVNIEHFSKHKWLIFLYTFIFYHEIKKISGISSMFTF